MDSSGKIYFSNASFKYDGHGGRLSMDYDVLEAKPNGALYVYDPRSKETKRLLKDLYFANGVALAKSGDFLLVSESTRYRLRRYWLTGKKEGTSEVFIDNLPGVPDGIGCDPRGGYWVSIIHLRTAYTDCMHRFSLIRAMAAFLPVWAWKIGPHYGLALHIDDTGKITDSLHDPTGKVFGITNIVPWENYLYIGSLYGNGVARYELSPERNNERRTSYASHASGSGSLE
jgi:hypothetical protein